VEQESSSDMEKDEISDKTDAVYTFLGRAREPGQIAWLREQLRHAPWFWTGDKFLSSDRLVIEASRPLSPTVPPLQPLFHLVATTSKAFALASGVLQIPVFSDAVVAQYMTCIEDLGGPEEPKPVLEQAVVTYLQLLELVDDAPTWKLPDINCKLYARDEVEMVFDSKESAASTATYKVSCCCCCCRDFLLLLLFLRLLIMPLCCCCCCSFGRFATRRPPRAL
jgi:hypothetical protein